LYSLVCLIALSKLKTSLAQQFLIRFMINTFANYLLTKMLRPTLINGKVELVDFEAYAQSKLTTTMWSRHMAN
jgi:hypothetical protein